MAEHRDRRPSGLCRTRAMQVNLICTRAHLVSRHFCCCYICAVGMFLMRRGTGDAGRYVLDTQASQPDGGIEPWTQAPACEVTPKDTDAQMISF